MGAAEAAGDRCATNGNAPFHIMGIELLVSSRDTHSSASVGSSDHRQAGVNVSASSGTTIKKNRPSPSARRAGSAQPPRRTPTLCTDLSNVTILCFDYNIIKVPSSRKHRFCSAGVGYRSQFSPIRQKLSLFLVSFVCIRVGVVSPSSSCPFYSANPISLGERESQISSTLRKRKHWFRPFSFRWLSHSQIVVDSARMDPPRFVVGTSEREGGCFFRISILPSRFDVNDLT